MEGIIRQGDVLLVPVNTEVPVNTPSTSEVVLAEGEMTGHAHRVKSPVIYEWSEGEQRYIHVAGSKSGELSHEDHDPIPAAIVEPEVTYRVVQQREWDLSGQWRQVRD